MILIRNLSSLRTLFVNKNILNYSQRYIFTLNISFTNYLIQRKPLKNSLATPNNTNNTIINRAQTISTTSKNNHRRNKDDESDDETDDEDEEDEDEDNDEEDDIDTSDFPKGYKIIKRQISSLRCDMVLAAGLGVARRKIEDNFYSSKIRLNGEKVLKKSKEIKESDRIDLMVKNKDGFDAVKRVVLHKIYGTETKSGKPKVCMIVWRSPLLEDEK